MPPSLELGTALVRWADPGSLFNRTGTPENYLHLAETQTAGRFHSPEDAAAYVAAHALLRSVLSDVLGAAPADLRFITGSHGKPELDPAFGDSLHFSLSHTRGAVACAVTRHASIGVDVEDGTRDIGALELSRRTCTQNEQLRLAAMPAALRAAAFLRSWTLKEATLKALGSGLSGPIEELEFEGQDASPAGARIHLARAPAAMKMKERWLFEQRTLLDRYIVAVAIQAVRHVDFREVRTL